MRKKILSKLALPIKVPLRYLSNKATAARERWPDFYQKNEKEIIITGIAGGLFLFFCTVIGVNSFALSGKYKGITKQQKELADFLNPPSQSNPATTQYLRAFQNEQAAVAAIKDVNDLPEGMDLVDIISSHSARKAVEFKRENYIRDSVACMATAIENADTYTIKNGLIKYSIDFLYNWQVQDPGQYTKHFANFFEICAQQTNDTPIKLVCLEEAIKRYKRLYEQRDEPFLKAQHLAKMYGLQRTIDAIPIKEPIAQVK